MSNERKTLLGVVWDRQQLQAAGQVTVGNRTAAREETPSPRLRSAPKSRGQAGPPTENEGETLDPRRPVTKSRGEAVMGPAKTFVRGEVSALSIQGPPNTRVRGERTA
jgi:hypothetical protein